MSAICTRLSVTGAEVFVLSRLSLEITVNMQYNDKKQKKQHKVLKILFKIEIVMTIQ